ncbi:Transposon Ty3-G Gag-Pol poly [Labeo rohita]|uniref:Gypsy retrotransposon integrase-like protein 1 n=1 Tax=Labeo rohita TaxID=84645 RepID=A0A498NW08_LABRO|nr:Transposon Ty3-G Gag-Pol poly [Labeo rohita]
METIRASGLRLNKEKCRFSQPELNFLGQVVTKQGIAPNPERVKAITAMDSPQNVSELRRLLGMINYIGRYLPNLSTVLQPLNELLKSERNWCWGPSQMQAFTEVKHLFSSAPVLEFFDPTKPTVVSADASSYGLGGVLMQNHDGQLKPVAFCSRTLTDAEKRYAQIEKECLAGVWASERFYQYLCGLETYKLLTDHKPLVTLINSKDLDTAPVRCQRLLIRLMKFNPIAEYVPGKHLVVADALSRHPMADITPGDLEAEVKAYVDSVEEDLRVRKPIIEQLKDRTGMDGELQCVLRYIRNGWPEYLKSVPLNVSAYFKERGSLSETNRLVLRGRQIVIPESLRGDMLQRIHQGHQGLTKCRERYRGAVWWPGIANDVKRLVSSCKHCNIHKPSQNKEPLITTPLPDLPWQKLAADLCEFKSRHYLIVIDYFSRWLEILELPKTTSDTVIQKLKGIFTRFGIPEQLMTDNGPQFSAEQFRHFAAEYDFHHVTSSPHFPQANGMAERAVRTAKWILKQDDPHQALLSYRSTRTEPTKESPARLLMGREIRTTLPVLKESLQPMWPDLEKYW